MGSKYNHYVMDSWLDPKLTANFDEVDKYKDLAGKTFINEDLAKFGQGEQSKIFNGQIGSTMLAGAARNQGARDIQGLKASQRLGSAAMSRGGNNAASAGVNLMYDRMLKNETGRVNDRTADQVVGGLPGYTNAAAGWAEAGNRGRAQQMQMGGAYQNMFGNAVQMRQSNQTFEKKKSFWDKFKEGVGVASQIAGIAGTLMTGIPMGGMGGGAGKSSGGQGAQVGTASRSGGYGQYY